MIIVEGPDGSGKSTLIKRLTERFQTGAIHEGGPPRSLEEIVTRSMNGFLRRGQILDRVSFMSEMVYGPVVRDGSRVSDELFNLLIDAFIRDEWIFIHCSIPVEWDDRTIVANMSKKEHETPEHWKSVVAKARALDRAYFQLFGIVRARGGIVFHYVRS